MSNGKEKEPTGLDTIHELDIDVKTFTLYLMCREDHPPEEQEEPGIEYRMANRFIRNINYLFHLDPIRPILVVMKTGGGLWEEGMAIYDAIFSVPNPVTIVSYAQASSMSSIIIQAANKRVLMPHNHFMFHAGESESTGTPKQIESDIKYTKEAYKTMLNIYEDVIKTAPHGQFHTWSRKRIRIWLIDQMNLKEEVYLTAEEAVNYGFADEMFSDWVSVFDYTDEQRLRK